jgi:hypothetical protein
LAGRSKLLGPCQEYLAPYNESLPDSPPLQFLENLKKVKKATIHGKRNRKNKENQALLDIEQQLKSWMEEEVETNYTEEQKSKILLLEQQKNHPHIKRKGMAPKE